MHALIYKTWISSTDTVKFIRLQEKQSYTKRYATSENYWNLSTCKLLQILQKYIDKTNLTPLEFLRCWKLETMRTTKIFTFYFSNLLKSKHKHNFKKNL
jgi:hypothetical protein